MSFAPNLFLSNIRAKDGPAKPCRFQVVLPIPLYISKFVENGLISKILNFPNSIHNDVADAINSIFGNTIGNEQSISYSSSTTRYLSLQCENTEFPGKSFITDDVKVYGPTFKVPYQTMYSDFPVSILCTNDFYERKLFDKWMEAISPTDTNNFRYPKGRDTRYLTNITIIQFDDFIRQIYAMELIDAYPISVAPQKLNWAEDDFHRLNVTFSYHKYRTIYNGTYDLGSAVSSVLGSIIDKISPIGKAI